MRIALQQEHLLQGPANDLWVFLEKTLQVVERRPGETYVRVWGIRRSSSHPCGCSDLVAQFGVELRLEFSSVKPESIDCRIEFSPLAVVGCCPREHQGGAAKIGLEC